MDDTTILGGVLGQLGQTVKQTVKQVVKLPGDMAGDLGEQIGGAKQAASAPLSGASGEPRWKSDEERIKFLKDLYGKSDISQDGGLKMDNKQATQSDKKPSEFQEQIADKSLEEQKKLLELRQQLHKDYYDALVNPPKPKEERPAEKVENEKKKEMMDLQQKEEKKPPPIAVQREQNKAEMFRGAAG